MCAHAAVHINAPVCVCGHMRACEGIHVRACARALVCMRFVLLDPSST